MPTPSTVLATLLRSDPARPRITFYEDTPGPTRGERIELSGKVLANWVSKAANALQEEFDITPGSTVRLDLPPHWRSVYWALATWSVGATLVLGARHGTDGTDDADVDDADHADLLVTTDPGAAAAAASPVVLVTLAALARQSPDAAAAGAAMDEARELSTYGDQFAAWDEPEETAPALRRGGADTAYATVVTERGWEPGARVHLDGTDLADVLTAALAAWAVDGSVVLTRGELDQSSRAHRVTTEGVTLQV
ncbi:MAG: TIGR03089 family protein [Pedococcus sp.]